jgi:hypothetical protein
MRLIPDYSICLHYFCDYSWILKHISNGHAAKVSVENGKKTKTGGELGMQNNPHRWHILGSPLVRSFPEAVDVLSRNDFRFLRTG